MSSHFGRLHKTFDVNELLVNEIFSDMNDIRVSFIAEKSLKSLSANDVEIANSGRLVESVTCAAEMMEYDI